MVAMCWQLHSTLAGQLRSLSVVADSISACAFCTFRPSALVELPWRGGGAVSSLLYIYFSMYTSTHLSTWPSYATGDFGMRCAGLKLPPAVSGAVRLLCEWAALTGRRLLGKVHADRQCAVRLLCGGAVQRSRCGYVLCGGLLYCVHDTLFSKYLQIMPRHNILWFFEWK